MVGGREEGGGRGENERRVENTCFFFIEKSILLRYGFHLIPRDIKFETKRCIAAMKHLADFIHVFV